MDQAFTLKLVTTAATSVGSSDAAVLAIVAKAIRDGELSFDPDAADGKGRWSGGTKLVKAVGEVVPDAYKVRFGVVFTKPIVNKASVILVERGTASVLNTSAVTDDELSEACARLLGVHTIASLYNELTAKGDDEPKAWSLSQALATVVAKARKEGIEDATVVETLLSILEGE